MLRLVFLLLLIVCAGLGAHIYLSETQPRADIPAEVNRDALKIAGIVDSAKAQQETQATRKLAENASVSNNASTPAAACVEFNVKPADATRAQAAFGQMQLGDRLAARNVEEVTRYGVGFPAQKNRQAAETIVANLKKTGLKEMTIGQDNSISLGVFSTEEKAQRHLGEILVKAPVSGKGAAVIPRGVQGKDAVFTIRDPDTTMVARLTVMQREYEGSNVKAIACPLPGANSEPAKNTKP
jgi:hypothetical protein